MSNQIQALTVTKPVTAGGGLKTPLGRILVVDDEPELRAVLVDSLQRHGYEVTGCGSGRSALAELQKQDFDLLLTDLMMPEMDGISLLKAALAIDPNLVGIILTGQGTIQTAVDAMQMGAFDYVLKPFRLQNLLPVMTRALNTRQLRLENLQLRETVAIHELTQTIAFTLDPQTVMSKLTAGALQQTEADEVSVLLPTDDGEEFYVAAARGPRTNRLLGERIPFDRSIASWVARERTPVILNGEVNDERFVALWPRPAIRSSVSVPMVVANKLIGVLNLNILSRRRPFTLGEMKALSILAGAAAAALESGSLYTQLRTTEEKYRLIFENATEGLFQTTPEGQLLTANPKFARIFGYDSPGEMIDTINDFGNQLYVNPNDRVEAGRLQEARGALEGFEMEAYRKDRERIWLSLNRRSVRNQEGELLYFEGSIDDITQRKRAAEERAQLTAQIESQRQRLNNIVASVPGVVWEAWGEPGIGTGHLDFASDYIETMLGYTVEECLAMPNFWLSTLHPDDREQAGRLAAEAFASGKSSTLEFRCIAKDGREVWLESKFAVVTDESGRPVGMRGVNTDIGERKRAEEALKLSEGQLAEAQRLAHIGSWNWDLEKNELTWSDEHYHIFGIQRGDIEVNNSDAVFNFINPEDRELVRLEVAKSIETKKPFNFFYRIARRDGEERIIQSSGSLETDGKGQPVRLFGTAQDVTDRERIGKELRQSEERYRDLVENAHDLIYEHDLQGNYTASNKAGERITGYSLEESLQLNLAQTLAPEYLAKGQEMLKRKLAGESVTAYDLVIVGKDGRRVPVEVNTRLVFKDGVPVGVQGIARDITERKRVEEELRESEERYRLLFDSNPQPMWVYDRETLAFLAVNESAVNHYGYSREEFLAMTIKDIRRAEGVPVLLDSLTSRAGNVDSPREWDHLKKDGSTIKVEITSHLLIFDGRPAELILAHDITERVRLEAALMVSEEQLRQSQKLEAVGQLAGGVAHDFNNLLTVIGGYSSILLSKLPKDSPHLSGVEEIKKASDRASGLTRQLLAFSRKQILQPKVLDLNIVVADLEKMLRRLIGEDIDLLAVTSPDLGKVKADPGQIEQVLLNLIVNARDAMPQGGKLTIETRNVIHSEEYATRHGTQPGGFVMLAVTDSGTGMEAATRERIFEPFFTTKSAGKGTGLGLATVYGIVKQSGGNIWVYSEVGRGTTFKVFLPRVDELVQKGDTAELEFVRHGTETILVVEDEEQVRTILTHILKSQGYQVLSASDGEQALLISHNADLDIKLLITDVVMPQMSGRELAEQVLIGRPNLPVLFMSGYTDDAIVRHGLLDEKLNFIQKPFDSSSVARKVREVLDSQVKTDGV